jgi:hypothetical protein
MTTVTPITTERSGHATSWPAAAPSRHTSRLTSSMSISPTQQRRSTWGQ